MHNYRNIAKGVNVRATKRLLSGNPLPRLDARPVSCPDSTVGV